MISADTNLFLYAYDENSPFYNRARSFFEAHAQSRKFAVCGLMLIELYMQLRNPAVSKNPLGAEEAADFCESLATHPYWICVDYEPRLLRLLWPVARNPDVAFRKIIDARLATTLIEKNVTEFATANVKDFKGFGFKRVWNPLQEV